MRFFLFSFFLIFLLSCTGEYRQLKSIPVDSQCMVRIVPGKFVTSWYHASVDISGKHFSGLLLVKNMPDSSTRVVFTNEAGITFLDFGFSVDRRFKVNSIIEKLNRKQVVETLQKDFELILGIPFEKGPFQSWRAGNEIFFGVSQKKETAYFITSKDCSSLQRLEWGNEKERRVSVVLTGRGYPSPANLEIIHHTFNMKIGLAYLPRE